MKKGTKGSWFTLVSDEDPVSLSSPLNPGTVQRVVRLLLQLLKVVHHVICLVEFRLVLGRLNQTKPTCAWDEAAEASRSARKV